MESARLIIEVLAGLIPGQPDPDFTRRFVITSADWNTEDADRELLLAKNNVDAQAYAYSLMMRPDRLNWVRTDWIYL